MTTTTTTTGRILNRAPKGGMVSPVNGQWYKGGQFVPCQREEVEARPASLEGSTRQVLWAARIRREELARLQEQVAAWRLILAEPKPFDAPAVRRAIRRDVVAIHRLMTERSARALIEARVGA